MLALTLACGNAERPVEPGPASSATPVERSAGEHAESESNEVAERPSSGETERSAPLAPPVDVPAQATDAAYLVVQNRGLFRWSAAGQERLFDGSIVDFAADDAGRVHVLAGVRHGGGEQHLFVLEGGQRRERRAPDTSLSIVALAPDGAPSSRNAFAGLWFRRGAGRSEVHEIDPSRIDIRQERPQALAVDSRGIVWVLGQRSVFRGDRGTYRREDLPERGDANLTAVAVGGGVTAVAAGPHLFIRRSRWERLECPLARLAVGGDGVVVAAFHERAAVVAEDADPVLSTSPVSSSRRVSRVTRAGARG